MQSHMSVDPSLLDSILSSLAKAGLHERAGELYEYLGRSQEALMAFRKGHAYRCECMHKTRRKSDQRAVDKGGERYRDAIAGIHWSTCTEGSVHTNRQHPEARAEIHFGSPDWFGSSLRIPPPRRQPAVAALSNPLSACPTCACASQEGYRPGASRVPCGCH